MIIPCSEPKKGSLCKFLDLNYGRVLVFIPCSDPRKDPCVYSMFLIEEGSLCIFLVLNQGRFLVSIPCSKTRTGPCTCLFLVLNSSNLYTVQYCSTLCSVCMTRIKCEVKRRRSQQGSNLVD